MTKRELEALNVMARSEPGVIFRSVMERRLAGMYREVSRTHDVNALLKLQGSIANMEQLTALLSDEGLAAEQQKIMQAEKQEAQGPRMF